jgi:hypothetical protein
MDGNILTEKELSNSAYSHIIHVLNHERLPDHFDIDRFALPNGLDFGRIYAKRPHSGAGDLDS